MTIATAMEIEAAMVISIKSAMKMLPMVIMDKKDSILIHQIPLEPHTDGHMERQEIICTLVVYAATLPLVTKVMKRWITLNMAAPLEWNDKGGRICWSRHNLK